MAPERYNFLRQTKIPFHSRAKLRHALPGDWESILVGEGIEFAASTPFEPGDDLRDLDLVELARSGQEEVIQRVVARQLRVWIWADWSGSLLAGEAFFRAKAQIRDMAIGLLLFSALNAYCPVGFCAFHGRYTRFREMSGERHCAEIWDWVTNPTLSCGTEPINNIPKALSLLQQNVSPRSLVFLVSDFQDPIFDDDFAEILRPAAGHCDLVAVVIRDPLECKGSIRWPICVPVKDFGGQGTAEIYLTPRRLRQIQAASDRHLASLQRNFRQVGVDHVVLDSPSLKDCRQKLVSFFEDRKRTQG